MATFFSKRIIMNL